MVKKTSATWSQNSKQAILNFGRPIAYCETDYLARTALYNRPIWQCEITGKQALTYKEALDSENTHREALHEKFPEGLKRQILEFVQFRGSKSRKAVSSQITYRVQMLDEGGNALRQKSSKKYITKTLIGGEAMSRVDKLSFTKTLIRQFIKESATKSTYVRAPWLIKLPEDLQKAKDKAIEKSKKRKKSKTNKGTSSNVRDSKKQESASADQLLFKGKKRQITPRNAAVRDNMKNESDSDPAQTDQANDESTTGSTWEILNELGKRWDKRIISPGDGRRADSDEDFEESYATLEVLDKLQILNFLVNITTKTTVIHDYIDRCTEKLVELNKEKNDLIKEKRQEEQIEKDKRKYALPRILPLGRDRFYNKYYYTDCIGAAVGEKYGTGRIFVETPSTYDLQIMTEKEEQRFNKRRKVEEISFGSGSDNQTKWGYYEDINQVCFKLCW
ncbi:16865_t:CDS:2 [Racocetra fulgida]|uniref:16865_t:CDS:1 n=1 Tax=Racocetra fulgida TaxID=60492 RepID=A0A9N9ANJ8_9GLOM|nr:16865_t:CDS:2 [Racocetra fulgida]